jgi:enoyl-CoA hydratase
MSGQLVLAENRIIGDSGLARIVTLNRHEYRNPLDHRTVVLLIEQIRAAERTPDLRSLVITGAGSAFSSGGDLRAYLSLYEKPQLFRRFLDDFRVMCDELEHSRLVTCAMVNGACVAGGLELALACDFITIADNARIGDGHSVTGQLPGGGGSQRLVRAVGIQRARDLLLTGRLLNADEALRIGLAHYQFAASELLPQTLMLLAEVTRHSPLVIRNIKRLIEVASNSNLADGLDQESGIVHNYATTSFDAGEGLRAFLEHRPAKYRGD